MLYFWAPVAIYMAAIFLVSADPSPPMPSSVSDKPLHALAYFGLAVLALRAVARGLPARVTRRRAVAALVIAVGYGATDELHQMFVPGRSAELYDLYADAIGAAGGLMACYLWAILGTPEPRLPNPNTHSR